MTASSRLGGFRSWPTWGRVATYVAVGLVLVLVVTAVAGVTLLRRPLPQTTGVLTVPGLSAEVEVLRDAQGVPHLYADTAADLFYAQGLVHAQDRFWQMDLRRHVTAGRLAELVGEPGVETDMVVRTLGWRRVAEQELSLLSPATVSYLESYAAGVNAWLEDRTTTQLAAEYSVLALGGLDYQPAPWTPVDSLAWLKAMAWDLRGNMEDEVARTRLAVRFPGSEVDQLYPDYPYDEHQPIVPGSGATAARSGAGLTVPTSAGPAAPDAGWDPGVLPALDAVAEAVEAVPVLVGDGDGIGSNSWVVAGEHTASGAPLLANDPHLGVSLPGVWSQVGLHCRTVDTDCPFDVAGFSFAGVPGVIIGHNQEIAWGLTNLDPDVTDLFLEQVSGRTYQYGEQTLTLDERDEVIRVAGGESRTISVRSTVHGPLLSDVSRELSSVGANADVPDGSPERGNGYAVALAWTALTPRPTMEAVFGFNRAGDWAEFREAAREFAVPSQNLVYADREGNIGYQAPGAIPVRPAGNDGRVPVAGWDPANDWTGDLVPFEELPSAFNPESGLIVTANQAVTGPGYPYLLTTDPDLGYRSQRILDLLTARIDAAGEGGAGLDADDMAQVQADTRHPAYAALQPALLRQLLTSEYHADGQRLLVDWDGTQPPDSAAAAYFNAVWRNLLALTFHDDLPEELWPDGGDRWVAVVEDLLEDPTASWWDDADTDGLVEDRDVVLAQALRDARDELTQTLSVSPRQWSWGRLHRLPMQHQVLGGHPLFGPVFDSDPVALAGGSSAVDATSWFAPEGYDAVAVPSMRMVVDLDDLDASRWVDLTGVSGHPASDHYDDQTATWAAGGSFAWPSSEAAVRAAAVDQLLLRPR